MNQPMHFSDVTIHYLHISCVHNQILVDVDNQVSWLNSRGLDYAFTFEEDKRNWDLVKWKTNMAYEVL